MNTMFNARNTASPQLNLTFDKENEDPASPSPANRTLPLHPKQPVAIEDPQAKIALVVDGKDTLVKQIRRAFDYIKLNPTVDKIAASENAVVAFVQRQTAEEEAQRKEQEAQQTALEAKNLELAINLYAAKDFGQEYMAMCDELLAKVEDGSLPLGGDHCTGANCEAAAALRREIEDLQKQVDNQYHDYIKLHDIYQKVRQATDLQKKEYAALQEKMKKEVVRAQEMKDRYLRLKESATIELERASADVTRMEEQHNEKTIGLRMKVKQLTTVLSIKDQELQLKKKELDELRDICNSLMNEVQPEGDSDLLQRSMDSVRE